MATQDKSNNWEVSVKTIPFRGLQEDWRERNMKVKAVAKKRGWYSALLNGLSIVPTSEDATQKAARMKANEDAYLWLVLSTLKRAFLHVESLQENAFVAWNNLLDLYEASNMMDLLYLLQDFTKCLMDGATDKLCFWFMELDHISEKISQAGGNRKSDSEKIAHVILEAPREYLPITDQIATNSRISGKGGSGSQMIKTVPNWLSMPVLRPIVQKCQDGRKHGLEITHGRSSKAHATPAASKATKRLIVKNQANQARKMQVLSMEALPKGSATPVARLGATLANAPISNAKTSDCLSEWPKQSKRKPGCQRRAVQHHGRKPITLTEEMSKRMLSKAMA
jgi:hypothetical protein